jgi:hypothetical protein
MLSACGGDEHFVQNAAKQGLKKAAENAGFEKEAALSGLYVVFVVGEVWCVEHRVPGKADQRRGAFCWQPEL